MTFNNTRCLTSFVVSCFSLAIVASAGTAPIAMLSGDSNVTVNGKPVKASQPAFAGDTIEAPGSSLGVIQFPQQGMARLSASARASLEQSGTEVWLGLQRGYVGIHEGTQPVSIRAHGGKISGDSGAVFEVAQVKDTTYVTAIKGSATISEGGLEEPQAVAQGQSMKVAFLEPGPFLTGMGSGLPGEPQAASGSDTTCKDLKATCAKDPSTCKNYSQRCAVCSTPCKGSGSSTQACTDFKALEKKCTPMRKACAADSSKCADYGKTCQQLAGCKGYGGILEANAAGAGAGVSAAGASASAAASTAASAAASTAAAAGAAATATATTAAVAAASAGAAVAGAAAAGTLSGSGTVSSH
jgi:hypothetical protein